jgi:hypothetical protein
MPYDVIIIKADGSIEHTVSAKAPDYKVLRAAVGGLIETVPYLTSITVDENGQNKTYSRGRAYINEEGLLIGLPFNHRATSMWREWPQSLRAYGGDKNAMGLVGDMIFYAKQKASEARTIATSDKSPSELRNA